MKNVLLIAALLFTIHSNGQDRFDTTISVIRKGANYKVSLTAAGSGFYFVAVDSVGIAKYSANINLETNGRTYRQIVTDSLPTILTRYKLTLK